MTPHSQTLFLVPWEVPLSHQYPTQLANTNAHPWEGAEGNAKRASAHFALSLSLHWSEGRNAADVAPRGGGGGGGVAQVGEGGGGVGSRDIWAELPVLKSLICNDNDISQSPTPQLRCPKHTGLG